MEATNITSHPNYNSTDLCVITEDHYNFGLTIAYESVILFISVLAVTGNIIVIYVSSISPELVHPMNYFIISLAASDLLHGLAYPLYVLGHHYKPVIEFVGHYAVCHVVLGTVVSSQFTSACNLAGLMIVRCIAVRNPLSFQLRLTPNRMKCSVCIVWLVTVATMCGLHVKPKPENYCGVCRSELFWDTYEVIGMMVFTQVTPSIVMITAFAFTMQAYIKHVKETEMLSQNDMTILQGRQRERRLSMMTAFLVAYFFLSYLPFMIYCLRYLLCKSCSNSKVFSMVARICLQSNIAVNFVAYIFGHNKFRRAMLRKVFKPLQKIYQNQNQSSFAVTESMDSSAMWYLDIDPPARDTNETREVAV